MRRESIDPRPNWRAIAAEAGYDFHTAEDGHEVWSEAAAYGFTLAQIEEHLEAPTAELHGLCLDLAAEVAESPALMRRLGIPDWAHGLVTRSFRAREPHLYGRFDLAYNGTDPAKMLEYNADTPTALLETAVFQWRWLEDLRASGALPADADQFNSVHERLLARLGEIRKRLGDTLHLTCMTEFPEDRGTVGYLADLAAQADLRTRLVDVSDIGLHQDGGRSSFVDRSGEPIRLLFELYPWEWMLRDGFGASDRMKLRTPMLLRLQDKKRRPVGGYQALAFDKAISARSTPSCSCCLSADRCALKGRARRGDGRQGVRATDQERRIGSCDPAHPRVRLCPVPCAGCRLHAHVVSLGGVPRS